MASHRDGHAKRAALQASLFETDEGPGSDAGAAASFTSSQRDDPPETPARRVVLVDGHGLAYRSYFGIRELSTTRGAPTNAVFGFTRALLDLLADTRPGDAVVVAFDAPARTFRHERFDEYKAGRAPTPDDLPQQIAVIKRLLDLLGVPRLETPGLEADDLIGTVATRCAELGLEVEVVTSDRDALQLVGEHVRVRAPGAKTDVGPAEVAAKYGVRPDQWVDYRALTGDASDNIPGVRGIGPVAARTLLQRYGTLDAILARLDELEPASYAARIREAGDDVTLSRELSTIVTDADIPVHPEAWSRREPERDALAALLRELEFGSVLHELGLARRVQYEASTWNDLAQTTLGRDVAAAAGAPTDEAGAAPWALGFVLDHDRPTEAAIHDLALAHAGRVASAPAAERATIVRSLRGELHAADAKALTVAARRAGAADVAPGDDPLLMAYLIDPGSASPEALARRLGAGEWGQDAASRAVATLELLRTLEGRLEGAQRRVYLDVERPLQRVLADMELAGVRVDAELLAAQSRALGERLVAIEAQVRAIAGDPGLNLASRDQVAGLLFDKLGLRAGRRTATGKVSTAVGALEPLKGTHEAVDLILEYRELAKLKNTYLDPLPALVDAATGRLHTTFQQAVVATGRLSSVNPNLQNVPVRTELGREVRRAFVADEGAVLLVADYSQIELRVLAHIADEPALVRAFHEGQDIHRSTAALVFGVRPDAITSDMRRVAKVINFGVLYGMSAQRLSRELEIPFADADAFIRTYFERYPRVRAYIDDTLARARETGFVETLLGRRRYVPDLTSPNRNVREAAERMAYNMPIQGSAADIMKLAMLALAPALAARGGRLLLQVHDEIVAEVPTDGAEDAATEVRALMAGAFALKVPLVADVGIGANWLDAK